MDARRPYYFARHLPRPLRQLGKRLADNYWCARGYRLGGALEGTQLRGEFLRAYVEGNYEPDVSDVIERIVLPGWTCVDVGAHVGYFTLLMARLSGEGGHVVAFEAHPGNFKLCRENVKLNSFDDLVRVENVAVSDGASEWVELRSERSISSSMWSIVSGDSGSALPPAVEKISATSLDAYFEPGESIDFVKIDIEGAEGMALKGMRRILSESRPFVVVEFHNEAGWDGRAELTEAEYALYDLASARWLDPDLDVDRAYHCLAVPIERAVEWDNGNAA